MDLNLALRAVERLLIVLTGALCIYLGYLLFVKGVSGKASLRVEHDKSKLQLANAMPGIFFALFGASILVFMAKQSVGYSVVLIPGKTARNNVAERSRLPSTSEEAKAILDLLGPQGTGTPDLFIADQEEARKKLLQELEKVSQDGIVIIHLAAHGSALPETPQETRPEEGKESANGQPRH